MLLCSYLLRNLVAVGFSLPWVPGSTTTDQNWYGLWQAPGAAELESQGAAIPKEQSMPQSWVKDVRPKSAGSNSTPSTPTIPSSRPAFLFSKSSTSTRSSQKLRHSRGKVGSNGLNSGDVPCSPIDVTVPDGAFAFGGITSRKAEQPLLVETQEENGVEITLST